MRNVLCAIFLKIVFPVFLQAQSQPIEHGHAHNDYLHEHPLFDALGSGFTSIEIDVFLYHNELKVSHDALSLENKKNIQQLYLNPIKEVIEQNNGSVYKGSTAGIIFMIDFKTSGETYSKLKEVLKDYADIISVYKGDSLVREKPIRILISGNAPEEEMLKEDTSIATIDADISDLNKPGLDKVVTRYSSTWGNYFTWRGSGQMSRAQKQKLLSLVTKAHEKKKELRFYHIPDKPNVWRVLLGEGVDWINTDNLVEYREFYRKQLKLTETN